MDVPLILFALFGFLAVVLALEGVYNLWASTRSAEARRIAARLAALQGVVAPTEQITLERIRQDEKLPTLQALIESRDTGRRLAHWVRTSGLNVGAAQVAVLSAGLAGAGFVAPQLFGRPAVLGIGLALLLAALPWWRVASVRSRRVQRFELQFPEALDLMGRAMRAGHAFPTAIKMVGDEIAEPLGRDFRQLFDEMNYGVPAGEALSRLAHRVPLPDVSYFVVAVMVQRESGGNLAELLDKIASIVRERLKLMGEVRTLSAEGRLSAVILTGLPFVVALAVNVVNPDFMNTLWTDRLGQRMVAGALVLMGLGILWMRKIIRIRV